MHASDEETGFKVVTERFELHRYRHDYGILRIRLRIRFFTISFLKHHQSLRPPQHFLIGAQAVRDLRLGERDIRAAERAHRVSAEHAAQEELCSCTKSVAVSSSRTAIQPLALLPYDRAPAIMEAPAAVEDAIQRFNPGVRTDIALVSKEPGERSIIFVWGVRVTCGDQNEIGWVCLASQHCRDNWAVIPLYSGRTSNATKHLKDAHNITLDKTQAEAAKKRTREDEMEDLKSSIMFRDDPARLRLLLETRRIVLNSLPFRAGEYYDSLLINDLIVKDQFRTVINSKTVMHSIIEMYAAVKREIKQRLRKSVQDGGKSLTIVADFWTCKPQHAKYLGVRVYFVDEKWKFNSVMLGTRRFNLSYDDREAGIRRPFKRWIADMLSDFGLSSDNFFGAMSDGGSVVKWMMNEGLSLSWEWCIPHMTNAATKWACGLVDNKSDSHNIEMTELMGDLFQALCQFQGCGKKTRLLDYSSHRFLGLTRVIERIRQLWGPLEEFFRARADRYALLRDQSSPPTPFLLAADKQNLSQLLSLLIPIHALNRKSQAEAAHQVGSLLVLYRLRTVTLDATQSLRDYQSPGQTPKHPAPHELTPLVAKTRQLLAEAFDNRFFNRYTDPAARRKQPFVFETQLFLEPRFKDLDKNLSKVVRFCNVARGVAPEASNRVVDSIKLTILNNVRKMVVVSMAEEIVETVIPAASPQTHFSDELLDMFGAGALQDSVNIADVRESRVEEELQ
ncbi:hypothetical protein FI667_g16610, partial [Globisporangium splendens]